VMYIARRLVYMVCGVCVCVCHILYDVYDM